MSLLKSILFSIRGVVVLLLLALATIPAALAVIIGGVFALLMPKKLRERWLGLLMRAPIIWIDCLTGILYLSNRSRWIIDGPKDLSTRHNYLLICNHQTWADIVILNSVFNHKTPPIKFFMKKQLLWSLPLAGFACWVLGYPFMERHSSSQIRKNPELKGKDLLTTRKACEKFKQYPTTIMNFVEGTRFTDAKHDKQQSPYTNLLKPKAGGLAIVLQEMQNDLAGIINATIIFPHKNFGFWNFACGNFDKLYIHYELIPLHAAIIGDYHNDREFRVIFQNWLNGIWQEKDRLLTSLMSK